jgi:hypothetical protein
MDFDCELFKKILVKFGPMFSSHMPFNKSKIIVPFKYLHGRKQQVHLADCLGLVLVWTRSINEYKAALGARHPLLQNCWATMAGLKLYIDQAGNTGIQERFYNGWTHDHHVTSVFCFCPDGTIPIAIFNVPGSVHNSQVAELGKIYKKLELCMRGQGG